MVILTQAGIQYNAWFAKDTSKFFKFILNFLEAQSQNLLHPLSFEL
jgi:hypothetical protein